MATIQILKSSERTLSEARENAFQNLGRQYAEQDPVGATAWLEKLPEGRSRDAAVGSFADALAASEPDVAAKWVETVSDENMRNSRMQMIAQRWMDTDPAAARPWIERSSIPADAKNWLLNRQDGSPTRPMPPMMDPRLRTRYGLPPRPVQP